MSFQETSGSLRNQSPYPDNYYSCQPTGQPWPSLAAITPAAFPLEYRSPGKFVFVSENGKLLRYSLDLTLAWQLEGQTDLKTFDMRKSEVSSLSAYYRAERKSSRKIAFGIDSTSDFTSNAQPLLEYLTNYSNKPGSPWEGVQLLDYGTAGLELGGWISQNSDGTYNKFAGAKGPDALVAAAPDLFIFCGLTNDVRQGNLTIEQGYQRMKVALDFLFENLPNTSVLLRMPVRFIATSDTYLVPNTVATAKAYSDIVRAVHLMVVNTYNNVELFDTQKEISGLVEGETNFIMSDSVHPGNGYELIGEALMRKTAIEKNPYNPAKAKRVNSFGPYYSTAYLYYGRSVQDTQKYWKISEGFSTGATPASLLTYSDNLKGLTGATITERDVVLVGNGRAYRPGDITPLNPNELVGLGGAIAQLTIPAYTKIAVYRHKFQHNPLVEIYEHQPFAYPYSFRGQLKLQAGAGWVVESMKYEKQTNPNNGRTAMTHADIMVIEGVGNPVAMTSFVFAEFQGKLLLGDTNFPGEYDGRLITVFGNHPYEDGSTYKKTHPDYPWIQTN